MCWIWKAELGKVRCDLQGLPVALSRTHDSIMHALRAKVVMKLPGHPFFLAVADSTLYECSGLRFVK